MISPIDVAVTQLGIREETGHNDGIPAARYMRGDKLAWCAGFAMWCYDASDAAPVYRTEQEWWLFRSVSKMETGLQRRGEWFGFGLHEMIRPGDLIFYANRGRSDVGRGRHVGLVEFVRDGRVHSIEGNLSDSVRRASHRLTDKRITGYGRPQ